MSDNAKPDENGDTCKNGHVMHNIHFDGAPILIVEDHILGAALYQPNRFTLAPRTHEVNNFTVPAPLTEAPAKGTYYYIASIHSDDYFLSEVWDGHPLDNKYLRRGLIHLTKAAAQQNALAMLGRDPAKGVEGV